MAADMYEHTAELLCGKLKVLGWVFVILAMTLKELKILSLTKAYTCVLL